MLILSCKEVESLVEVDKLPAIIEEAFSAYALGEAIMPAKIYLDLARGDFRAMPAYLKGSAGLKWICFYPRNPEDYNLPTIMGILIYSDPETGKPLALMEASALTRYRTAAASAVATRHLASPGAKTLGIVGCGVQAHAHLEVLTTAFSYENIYLYDLDQTRTSGLKKAFPKLPLVATSLEEACGADVVCTLTPARKPVVERKFIKAGTHINAIGADASGKQELEIAILKAASVFVDDLGQSVHGGEINVAISTGALKPEALAGTLGEVTSGKLPGRRTKEEITVFDSTGLAIQDIALAKWLYDRSMEKNTGLNINLL